MKVKHSIWCEQSPLLGANIFVKNLAIATGSYSYNAIIERVWKLSGQVEQMSLNGRDYYDMANLSDRTLYASPYLVATDQNYTKHYFIESERICSKIGGGFNNVDLMNNWVEPIEGDINTLSENLTTHVANSLYCSFENALVQTEPQLNGIEDFINLNQTEEELYFTHSDHLGSSSFITDASGEAVQHLQYLPFGESFVSQTSSSWESRYSFSGKEKDAETGYSYFGARYYDSDLSVWLSMDPLADKYPSMSPFMYTAGNPVMLVDPDGRYLLIYYEKNGEEIPFVFKGTNFSSAPQDPFVQAVLKAYKYNVANGGGGNLLSFAFSKKTHLHIFYSIDTYAISPAHQVYWNPYSGLLTTDNRVLSPATTLEHEAGHVQHYIFDFYNWSNDRKTEDKKYTNKEERRTIELDESWTAQRNNEVPKGWIRPDHDGSPVGVIDPTSNVPNKKANDDLYKTLNNKRGAFDWSQDKKRTDNYLKKNTND